MKPKNFIVVLPVLAVAGFVLWHVAHSSVVQSSTSVPATHPASDATPFSAWPVQSQPRPEEPVVAQPTRAPAAPPVSVDLKDDPQVARLVSELSAQREIRRQVLEQSLLQLNDQPGSPVQTDFQNRLDELKQPFPPPTDFGSVAFADGVPVELPLASGELATLMPTVQPNGLLRLDLEVAPAHPNRFSSPEKGGFADAPFGQPKVFTVNDHIIRIVPLLK